jgi:hypothetical protein
VGSLAGLVTRFAPTNRGDRTNRASTSDKAWRCARSRLSSIAEQTVVVDPQLASLGVVVPRKTLNATAADNVRKATIDWTTKVVAEVHRAASSR